MKVNLKVYDERLFDLIDPEAEFETVVDSMRFYRRPANARVYTQVDVRRFWHLFLSRILSRPDGALDLIDSILCEEE